MRGDILLYTSKGTLFDRLICFFTNGPYCHVEVDLGDDTTIGAHSDRGVVRSERPTTGFFPVALGTDRVALIEQGISFLEAQLGNGYGFIDIVNQVLKVMRSPVFLAARDQYDCSDLVARYLAIVGGPLYTGLGDLAEEPHMVTPNDIARAAGLIDQEGRPAWLASKSSKIGKPLRATP